MKKERKKSQVCTLFSIAESRKNAYTPYSDTVLRHDKICCTTDKSPFKKEPIEDVCNERSTVLKTEMKVKLLVNDGLTMLFQLGEFFFSVHRHSLHICHP